MDRLIVHILFKGYVNIMLKFHYEKIVSIPVLFTILCNKLNKFYSGFMIQVE